MGAQPIAAPPPETGWLDPPVLKFSSSPHHAFMKLIASHPPALWRQFGLIRAVLSSCLISAGNMRPGEISLASRQPLNYLGRWGGGGIRTGGDGLLQSRSVHLRRSRVVIITWHSHIIVTS